MDYRTRFIAPCANWEVNVGVTDFYFSHFIERLLLYDHYILDSQRLRELPFLLDAFGYDGVMALLKSGAIVLHFNPVYIVGSPTMRTETRAGQMTIIGFDYGIARFSKLNEVTSQEMKNTLDTFNITGRKGIRLKEQIAKNLISEDQHEGEMAHQYLMNDIKNNSPLIKQIINLLIQRDTGNSINSDQYDLKFHFEEGLGYRVETNLPTRANIKSEIIADTVLKAGFSLGNLNQSLEKMKTFSALTGIPDEDITALDGRINFLISQNDPNKQIQRFNRTIELTGLPLISKVSDARDFDINRVLKIRNTPECQEFRAWLWGSESISDNEIITKFTNIKSKLGTFFDSNIGRTLRCLTTSAIGLAPSGIFLGPTASALDTFLIDKCFPKSGPLIFLSKQYPTIFKKQEPDKEVK